jgi:norsolorinic acid ketoreductase
VTGAARGIGYKLVEELSARPNTIVYAGVRSFPLAADQALSQLVAKLPHVVFPIKLTSADPADNQAAAESINAKVGKVDVIIANAGESHHPNSRTSPRTLTSTQA